MDTINTGCRAPQCSGCSPSPTTASRVHNKADLNSAYCSLPLFLSLDSPSRSPPNPSVVLSRPCCHCLLAVVSDPRLPTTTRRFITSRVPLPSTFQRPRKPFISLSYVSALPVPFLPAPLSGRQGGSSAPGLSARDSWHHAVSRFHCLSDLYQTTYTPHIQVRPPPDPAALHDQLLHALNPRSPTGPLPSAILAHAQYNSHQLPSSFTTALDTTLGCYTSIRAFNTSSLNLADLPEGRLILGKTYLDIT
ncbi:hypothetical protein K491DRAFT_407055 [Lophiostoma macrostomum CBS 122681]|uniref:Uncharacterized protein n=1 Tax=Lophiostoma macrostomum CBS 122681 TaxID=1314788 RepID=A0A6A6T894_9PLEO|nr:hypothetical protein K491DRAFT_407055 [Lophiostoma macrostomum CBS 122681]